MNYSKCDFSPIIGADVEIETDFYNYKGKLLCKKWTTNPVFLEKLSILESRGSHCFETGAPVDEIISLKATMKPKDMNLEQLTRLAEEIASEHHGERYEGIKNIYHHFEDGKLDDICVDLCNMPSKDGFVIDPNKPVDITHWLKEDQK